MFITTTLRTFAPFIAGIAIGAGAVATVPVDHHEPPNGQTIVLADVVSDVMWDDLRAQGYRGDPSDGMEALYVPRDVAAAACRTDLDCALYGSWQIKS